MIVFLYILSGTTNTKLIYNLQPKHKKALKTRTVKTTDEPDDLFSSFEKTAWNFYRNVNFVFVFTFIRSI